MTSRSVIVLLVAIACAHPQRSAANAYADPERDCQSAATLLGPGDGPTPQMAPALWRVRACPTQAGEILAALLRSVRTVSDTSALDDATWLTQYVHDAHILAAGLDVAVDSAAAPEARVAALRALLWSKAPGHLLPLRLMIVPPSCDPRSCSSTFTGHFYGGGPVLGDTTRWPVFGAPMPNDYATRIDSVAIVLERRPATPEPVRRAAQLVRGFPRDRELADR